MNKNGQYSIFALRIALGWIFLFAGLSKIFNSEWSAAGYLKIAKSFPGLFNWFASSSNIGWVNFLNEWGLTLVGISLITGILVKYASYSGIVLMMLYYLPILDFPKAGNNSFIIDEHIIYIIIFSLFITTNTGEFLGLGKKSIKN